MRSGMRPCVICGKVTQSMRFAKYACCNKCIDDLIEEAVLKRGLSPDIVRPWWVE